MLPQVSGPLSIGNRPRKFKGSSRRLANPLGEPNPDRLHHCLEMSGDVNDSHALDLTQHCSRNDNRIEMGN